MSQAYAARFSGGLWEFLITPTVSPRKRYTGPIQSASRCARYSFTVTMCTPSPQRVEIGRERRHQRLALAGAHLGDHPLVQHDAADQLHIEVAHLQRAPRRLAHHRERLGQQLIEGRARLQALAELLGAGAQRLVTELLDLRLELVGGAHCACIATHEPLIAAAENAGEKLTQGVTR